GQIAPVSEGTGGPFVTRILYVEERRRLHAEATIWIVGRLRSANSGERPPASGHAGQGLVMAVGGGTPQGRLGQESRARWDRCKGGGHERRRLQRQHSEVSQGARRDRPARDRKGGPPGPCGGPAQRQ